MRSYSTFRMYEKCIQNFGQKTRKEETRPRRSIENNIRMDLREQGGKVWTGCIWLWIGTSGGLL
jgi:hypothetical protein